MNILSYLSKLLVRTNAQYWSHTNSYVVISEVNYFNKKNYIEDLILSGHFWGGTSNKKYTSNDIIVSLTTYGLRLNYVHLAIASIMLQTKKANRIILWLGNEYEKTILPDMLQKLVQYGLEIKYTRDIRSYKKLIPALKEFPHDTIITIDDDVIYDVCLLEHLINAHLANSNCIYGMRCHRITMQGSSIAPYDYWEKEITTPEESLLVLPTGVGGILYPPNSLDEEVMNEDVFMDLCPTTDDIWFKVMSLKKSFMTGKSTSTNELGKDYYEKLSFEKTGLMSYNLKDDVNGKNLRKLLLKYNLSL